jgi:hypothetical protein
MSDGKTARRKCWSAAPWFAVALVGAIWLSLGFELSAQSCLLVLLFPTTTIGIGGGIGTLYGNPRRGIGIALSIYPVLFAATEIGGLTMTALYKVFWPDQIHL